MNFKKVVVRASLGLVLALSCLLACSAKSSSSSPASSGNDNCTFHPPSGLGTIGCSCDSNATALASGTCADYGGQSGCALIVEDGGNACPVGGGSTNACPTANRVGSCFGTGVATRYFSPTFTTASAKADCDALALCFVAN